jgi:hypothetical protein
MNCVKIKAEMEIPTVITLLCESLQKKKRKQQTNDKDDGQNDCGQAATCD